MLFDPPLQRGILIKRYKRFLADILLDSGETIVAHCPNPGSMKTCAEPGWIAWVSPANNPKRKLKWTLEIIESPEASILVNTSRPNSIVAEAIELNKIPELTGYSELKREVRYGENSRIDLLLLHPEKKPCYVEIKNVSLLLEAGLAAFPDSVTKRGTKHLKELVDMHEESCRSVMLFLVSRTDVERMTAADSIDPVYASTLRWAKKQGVEILAYRAEVSNQEISISTAIPVLL